MAKYKSSTLGESLKEEAAPAETTVLEAPAAEAEGQIPVNAETPVAQAAAVPAIENTQAPVDKPEAVIVTEAPANEGVFEVPGQAAKVQDAPATAATVAQKSWQEQIKEIDRKELYKELGLPDMDDFTLEFAKFRNNGGDPYQYIAAKSFDWTKVNDVAVIKDDLTREYPNLSAEKIDALFNEKYKQGEYNTDEEKAAGSILLEADAYKKRNTRIAEQQSFKIPEVASQNAALTPEIQGQLQAIQQYAQRQQELQSYVKENGVTKQLFDSKRVAVDLGDGNTYNFKVDNPQLLQDVLLDNETAAKYGVNAQGEPDMQLAYELAMFKINPVGFKKALLNYGKSLGQQSLIAEGQNAVKPAAVLPVTNANKFIIKGEGTLGG